MSLAVLSAAGQVLGDAVEQGERAIGVDGDDVIVELNAFGFVRIDVRRFVIGIEGFHALTLKVRCHCFDSDTTN